MSEETPVERRLRNVVDDHLLFKGHAGVDLYAVCVDIRIALEALQLLRWRADTAHLVDLTMDWQQRVDAVLAKARKP